MTTRRPTDHGRPADDATPTAEQADAVEALQREKDALQDRLLRTAAEFDNYRKRIERERRELVRYAAGRRADRAAADRRQPRARAAGAGRRRRRRAIARASS